jgi:hypothetical protein
MSDCRFLLDNLNDHQPIQGKLMTRSGIVDISGAEMRAGDSAWKVRITTVGPALQHPALETSVALYLDIDGRYENNAAAGFRLGADQVYGIVSRKEGWQVSREVFVPASNKFVAEKTSVSYSFEQNAYVLEIPFSELPKDAKAFWRVGAAERDNDQITADYAPDGGFSCAVGLASPPNPWLAKAKDTAFGWPGKIALLAVVIMALAVLFWRKRKKGKE